MGLDVYLYRAPKQDNLLAALDADNEHYGEDGYPKVNEERVENDSALHPEHYWKVGYFRSSYNAGGIDRVLGDMFDTCLDELFGTTHGEYMVFPDWEASRDRVKALIEKWDAHIAEHGSWRVAEFDHNIYAGPPEVKSEADALRVFLEERKRGSTGSYMSRNGSFFFDEPLKAVAVIAGETRILGARPCQYVVFECDLSHYRQALEIAVETCEHVLQRSGNGHAYYLHWSG